PPPLPLQWLGSVMASRLLDRLKRSLFKDGQAVGTEQEAGRGQEEEDFSEDRWEAELAEEEECVTDRLGGLCASTAAEEELRMELKARGRGWTVTLTSWESQWRRVSAAQVRYQSCWHVFSWSLTLLPADPAAPESWRSLRGLRGGSPTPSGRQLADSLMFEVTDASVVQDGSSKYVLYTIHVIQSGGCDKTPAIITCRYSDFQRLHATLRRHYGDQMERVCFPRKKLRRNFTAETIAKRSRAFEQYLSHLCSLSTLRGALCVRQFFYLTDLQTGQLLIRVGRHQEALGPLLNAKRLQHKLGWASYYDSQAQAPSPTSSHWFFTLVGLSCCFQEVDQLEEARITAGVPRPFTNRPHPLLLPLLRAVVRLSWQTGKDKRHWEELLQHLEEQWAELDNQPTIKEFL
ncbi:hypothetical protein INR49_004654, partial [Caranx melampygus]